MRPVTTRDAQIALEAVSGRQAISRGYGRSRPFEGIPNGGVGVTWEVPRESRRGVEEYPHATGPNPSAPQGSVGREHHVTTTRGFQAAVGYAHLEADALGGQTPIHGPSPWRIIERVHHPVLAGGGLGPAVHDQHLAVNMIPLADGTHEVRSATVVAATHQTPGSVIIRPSARVDTVSRTTAFR